MRMFFTYVGRGAAFFVLFGGLFQILMGFAIAFGAVGPAEDALARYLPAHSTTGGAIDDGFKYLLIAIVLGTLTEISFSLRNSNQ
jgi:hypothetical protein